MLEAIQAFDWAVLHRLYKALSCGFLDFLMPKITALGNGGIIWIIAAAALLISKKYRKYGIVMLISLLAGLIVGNLCLKNLIARQRPCWMESGSLLISNPTDYSFPSGHTLSSVIGAYVLTSANRKFGFAAIPLAVLIAFSRLYLFVHFPTDIIASVILGIGIGFLSILTFKKLQKAKNTRKHISLKGER